ncbi:MAG: hypothetical protein H7Z75_17265 [Ferruginibacter sp.]|nr:hypothetical protein [Cytophagales bacterium]
MKTATPPSNRQTQVLVWLAFVLIGGTLGACKDDCRTTVTYKTYEPVYMLKDSLRNAVVALPARTLENPGKIYVRGDYVFVNEPNQGIHVINNRNPSAPQPVSFLNIPGNRDLAVRGDILYADSYIDLVALDIRDPNQVVLVKRIENVFPAGDRSATTVLVEYKEKWVTQTTEGDCNGQRNAGRGDSRFLSNDSNGATFSSKNGGQSAPSAPGKPGVGGSMARFTIYDRYLYTVGQSEMQLFDITQPADPQKGNKINLGNQWNIETIFPYRSQLFIGSQNGMHIYDNRNPEKPELLSTYQHVRSCDPVVVEGDYAYVTLRSGTACQGFTNQLEVLDISDLRKPTPVKIYPMQNPHGLGIDRATLFLCEGTHGLKVFNAKDVRQIDQNLLAHFKDLDAYDVIPLGEVLLVVGKKGLYQYDYSDPKKLKLLSVIPVVRS